MGGIGYIWRLWHAASCYGLGVCKILHSRAWKDGEMDRDEGRKKTEITGNGQPMRGCKLACHWKCTLDIRLWLCVLAWKVWPFIIQGDSYHPRQTLSIWLNSLFIPSILPPPTPLLLSNFLPQHLTVTRLPFASYYLFIFPSCSHFSDTNVSSSRFSCGD